MPAISDITVKKADGTTDIVYGGLQGASGDGVDAIWRQDTGNTLPLGMRPMLRFQTRRKPNGDVKVIGRYFYPIVYIDTTTSKFIQGGVVVYKLEGDIPLTQDPTKQAEGSHQGLNLLASSAIRSACANGMAPT